MEKDIQFKKNFIWNIIGTGFNAFNSLFFMIAITRINGVDNAGIYTIAYSTACILYMIGIYAGRIYQVTESNKTITNKDYIFNRMISCSIIFVISILFVIIKRYDMYKSSIFIILALYKSLEAFSDVLYGILQKNNFLDKAGKSCFIKALLSLIVFILIDIFTHNLQNPSLHFPLLSLPTNGSSDSLHHLYDKNYPYLLQYRPLILQNPH